MNNIVLEEEICPVRMTTKEKALYLQSQSGISDDKKSLSVGVEEFDVTAGHDITRFLRQNVSPSSRKQELSRIVGKILEKDSTTKIVVFTDGRIGGGVAAREALFEAGLGCTWLDPEQDSVKRRCEKISWYQRGDATTEDQQRPRVLVLHFEHAAGLNLQSECYNLILFSPYYEGAGGTTSDPVADTSTELQAIGRVHRPGQPKPVVKLYRIHVSGPDGEECLDGQLIRRNTDPENVNKAINAGDD
jgi:hypothetical protein